MKSLVSASLLLILAALDSAAQESATSKVGTDLQELKAPLVVLPRRPVRADADLLEKYRASELSVAEIVAELLAARSPEDDPYANSARAQAFALRMSEASEEEIDSFRVKVAHERLRAGDYDTAAVDLADWLGGVEPPELETLSADERAAWQLLATAELRRTLSSIAESGEPLVLAVPDEDTLEEVDRESLDTAARIFEAYAKANPDDAESRWLLNLSRLVADDYPDGVVEDLLIPDLLKKRTQQFPEHTRISLPEVGHASALLWVDVTGDGQSDLLRLSAREGLSAWDRGGEIKLELGFETIAPGGIGLSAADIDNDGSVEILILRDAGLPNTLVSKSEDSSLYIDITKKAGLLSFLPSSAATWSDFDRDGFIDLAIANEKSSLQLFRNLGDGTFTEVAWDMGLHHSKVTSIKHLAWADIDQDEWPDLIISAEETPLQVWRGIAAEYVADWRFSEAALGLGIDTIGGGPVWTWDFDNDGAIDLGCVSDGKIKLFRNDGDGFAYTDLTSEVELDLAIGDTGAAVVGDIDNDGYLDLAIGTGGDTLAALAPNRVFWNRGSSRFREITLAGGFGLLEKTPSAVFADLAGDGDLDLINAMGGRYESDNLPAVAFDNPGNAEHGNILVTLHPPVGSNADAIGAKIELTIRDRDWILQDIYRFVTQPGPQLIGIGAAKKVESIQVTWPIRGAEPEEIPIPDSKTGRK